MTDLTDNETAAVRRLPAGALEVVALICGLVTGGFAAWAYYDELLRPLAHTFGLWITLVALLAARQQLRPAVVRGCLALIAAVLAFYVGKKVMYGIEYPGMPYSLNGTQVMTWLVLAVLGGGVLGAAFSRIGRSDRWGPLATAAVVGLLIADAYRRSTDYPADAPVVISFAVLAVVAVLTVAIRSFRQLAATAAWTIPMTLLGLALVSAPDVLEQLLITGGF